MSFISKFNQNLLKGEWDFEVMTNSAFDYQYLNNSIFSEWVNKIGSVRHHVSIEDCNVPFLPISFFKTKNISSGIWHPSQTFTSSGTSLQSTSKHNMFNLGIYNAIAEMGFNRFYGPIDDYQILALLPSYFDQPSSSLLHMIDHFIQKSAPNGSRYILDEIGNLDCSSVAINGSKKLLLWGVSYALLDLLDSQECYLPKGSIVLETGGMKGRRKELPKEELHSILRLGFSVDKIHSEYGMTELSSQAYSNGDGLFYPSPTMKVCVNEISDPLSVKPTGRGQLNIIDLANIHSCCFIQTDDVGEVFDDGSFRIFGRLDNSLLRGCNLLHP